MYGGKKDRRATYWSKTMKAYNELVANNDRLVGANNRLKRANEEFKHQVFEVKNWQERVLKVLEKYRDLEGVEEVLEVVREGGERDVGVRERVNVKTPGKGRYLWVSLV